MQHVIEEFGFDFVDFRTFLVLMKGHVAGSAALYAFLSRFERNPFGATPCMGTEITRTPNDIDVWIPVPSLNKGDCQAIRNGDFEDGRFDLLKVSACIRSLVRGFMNAQGFEEKRVNITVDEDDLNGMTMKQRRAEVARRQATYLNDTRMSDLIHRIMYFEKDGDAVQVMLTCDEPIMSVLNDFDLSICKIAWDPVGDFIATHEVLTDIHDRRAVMSMPDDEPLSARAIDRIKKYNARGFRVMRYVTRLEEIAV